MWLTQRAAEQSRAGRFAKITMSDIFDVEWNPPMSMLWKTLFLVTLGSLAAFSGDEGQSWSRDRSWGHCCEVWTLLLMSVESFSMLQIGVRYPPGVGCRGLWSDLLAGSLIGWRGFLRHFPMLSFARSLLETSDQHSVWKNTENAVD